MTCSYVLPDYLLKLAFLLSQFVRSEKPSLRIFLFFLFLDTIVKGQEEREQEAMEEDRKRQEAAEEMIRQAEMEDEAKKKAEEEERLRKEEEKKREVIALEEEKKRLVSFFYDNFWPFSTILGRFRRFSAFLTKSGIFCRVNFY